MIYNINNYSIILEDRYFKIRSKDIQR
jgi:hypothetical protein